MNTEKEKRFLILRVLGPATSRKKNLKKTGPKIYF